MKHGKHGTVLTPDTVYFPKNGAVVRKGSTIVRLVYANKELTDVILEAIKKHLERQADAATAPGC